MTTTSFTDTRRFKVMRTLVGAANPFVRRLLASRFGGGAAKALLLLEFRGRVSGRTFRTPVGYVRDGDRIVVVTSPSYAWWKNVVGGAAVRVRLPEGWREGTARVLQPDQPAYDAAIATQVAGRGPGMLRGFGLPVTDDGILPASARATATDHAHLVQIDLAPAAKAAA